MANVRTDKDESRKRGYICGFDRDTGAFDEFVAYQCEFGGAWTWLSDLPELVEFHGEVKTSRIPVGDPDFDMILRF